ncbi:GumN [Shewanella denitrificans OS217]|uniref:GumN n=1 Tax=Shewanella denitrificans (strain OS217 / ATCC BAA-1090 / DSM 15013) TaxID=318161 RepID=Q12RG4_SHEDO|nr:TraB/GumN family protein [Shewanella denitrificans]ABE53962.1 GumN [Shewanella denitrificans OS217]
MTTSQSVRKTAIDGLIHANKANKFNKAQARAGYVNPLMLLSLLVLSLLVLSVLLASFNAQSAESDRPPFYKIQYQGKQAYLLGSIHIGRGDFYPMPAQIEQAFSEAKALVVEADIAKANVPALLKRYGMSQIGENTSSSNALHQYCVNNGALCQALSGYAPWLKAAQISLYRFGSLGYQADFGVDSYWVAKKGARPLLELESVAFQFELISSFKPKTQQLMLDEAIAAEDVEMLALIHAWRAGDSKALADIMSEQADDAPELVTELLWRRNHTMTAKIIELFEANKDQLFIVIGAGHLVGEQAIPDLLKAKGVAIIECWKNDCK